MRILPSFVLGLLLPTVAFDTSPATDYGRLCNSSHVIFGHVDALETTPQKCVREPGAYCGCLLQLKVRVDDVLAVSDEVSRYPDDVGITSGRTVSLVDQRSLYPSKPLTSSSCLDVSRALLGQDFII